MSHFGETNQRRLQSRLAPVKIPLLANVRRDSIAGLYSLPPIEMSWQEKWGASLILTVKYCFDLGATKPLSPQLTLGFTSFGGPNVTLQFAVTDI